MTKKKKQPTEGYYRIRMVGLKWWTILLDLDLNEIGVDFGPFSTIEEAEKSLIGLDGAWTESDRLQS